MGYRVSYGRRVQPFLLGTLTPLIALLAGFLNSNPVQGQVAANPPVLASFVTPDNSAVIDISADEVVAWNKETAHVFLLKGKATVRQGAMSMSMDNGVVWMSQSPKSPYRLDVYGEGAVHVIDATAKKLGPVGLVHLETRGDVDVHSVAKKIPSRDFSSDPVFLRAVFHRKELRPGGGREEESNFRSAGGDSKVLDGTSTSNSPARPRAEGIPAWAASIALSAPATANEPTTATAAPFSPEKTTTRPGSIAVTATQAPAPGAPVTLPIPTSVSAAPNVLPSLTSRPSPPEVVVVPPGPAPASTQPARFPLAAGSNTRVDPAIQPVQAVLPAPAGPSVVPVPVVTPNPSPPPSSSPFAGMLGDRNAKYEVSIQPRSSIAGQTRHFSAYNAVVYTGGITILITKYTGKKEILDVEADRVVAWYRPNNADGVQQAVARGGKAEFEELYLAGNVEIRYQGMKETEILRCDEAYLDVKRAVAVALKADLEIREPRLPNPIHMQADEIQQLGPKIFQANNAKVYSTVLPSDPGFRIELRQARIEERQDIRRTIFGTNFVDSSGNPQIKKDRFFTGDWAVVRLEGVPIFAFPSVSGRVEDPFGPLEGLSFGANRIFGFQLYSTWDVFELLGMDRPEGQRWRLYADILTERGPALGTEYEFSGKEILGVPARYDGLVKAWGLHDQRDFDQLGGNRGAVLWIDEKTTVPVSHPDWRGRFLAKTNIRDLPNDFTVQGQISLLSDQNFLEQFYYPEFANDYNQETSLYVKQQRDNWAWSVLGEVRLRDWVTETNWLPKADGYVIGMKPFELLTWNMHAGAGYAQLRPGFPPPAFYATDGPADTGRFHFWNEIGLPVQAGPVNIVPYLVGDASLYTEDLKGDTAGRLYGGAGVRASIPFSKLYPSVQSELFNLNGLYHKVTLHGNYYISHSDTPLSQLPQLDRLQDDASDFALRAVRPFQQFINPTYAKFLNTSPVFDQRLYVLRRQIDNREDTLDTINVLQLGARQRWQTKRGFPGKEHVIDWMTLDLQATFFPHSNRDNFGEHWGVLEYDWLWNIGDQTALTSYGWMEPVDNGPRLFNVGAILSRFDNTSLYVGYRHLDPLNSRAVVASVTYTFSPKYALGASTTWDFGTETKVYNVSLTRLGTDLRMSLGVNYNSNLQTFGFNFEIVPNLIAGSAIRSGGVPFGMANQTATGMAMTSSQGR